MNLRRLLYSGCIQMSNDIARENPALGAEAQIMIAPLAASNDPVELRAACETLATWIKLLHTEVVVCPKS